MSKASITQRLTKLEQRTAASRVFVIYSNDPEAAAKLAEAHATQGDKTIIRVEFGDDPLWTPNGEITPRTRTARGRELAQNVLTAPQDTRNGGAPIEVTV